MITVIGALSHLGTKTRAIGPFLIQPRFVISQDWLDEQHILDSFVATPSRYLFEMVRRTSENQPKLRRVLIFNPLLRPSAYLTRLTLARVAESDEMEAVVRSSNGLPIAYLLNLDATENYRHLLLLSCSDADLDTQLLFALYFRSIETIQVNFPCSKVISNGFLTGAYWRPMEWCAANAIAVMKSVDHDSSLPIEQRKALRNSISIKGFFTHHAGDVLFMTIAAMETKSVLFDEILTHESYLPITQKLQSMTSFAPVSGPLPFRGNYRKEDCNHFLDQAPHLPSGAFYVYCRTTRNYNFTNFHYIDHFRFSLGEALLDRNKLHFGHPHPQKIQHNKNQGMQPCILLHFDAGWPLKIYPKNHQKELVQILQAHGLQVIVLDAPAQFSGVETARFGSLTEFDVLLDRVDILVGMDSFPAHYAAQIRGIRTIHLFSSTHPVHSSAEDGKRHLSLQNGKSCSPCMGWDKCIRYGGAICHNFSNPADVMQAISALLLGVVSVGTEHVLPPPPSSKCPRQFHAAADSSIVWNDRFISISRLRILAPVAFVMLFSNLITILLAEFIQTVRREGLRKAIYLTKAFLRRHFSKFLVR